MALQGSGGISLAQIRTEFGGSNPVSMSQYYRGGARVPNTGPNANVPTSGLIRMSNFYGAAAYVADLIPNAINMQDVMAYDDGSGSGSGSGMAYAMSGSVTFSGISEPISLTLDMTNGEINAFVMGGGASAYMSVGAYVNGTGVASISWNRPTNGQTTNISRSMTFTMPVNGTLSVYVDFSAQGFQGSGGGGASGTINIKNASSSNTLLDTFVVSASANFSYGGGGGGGPIIVS